MPKVCFVLPELFPVTQGGIGKLASNILDFYGPQNFSICWTGASEKLGELRKAYPEVEFFQPKVGGFDHKKFSNFNYSFLVAEKLMQLEMSGTQFDFIEFCDFQGFGFFATQLKKTGMGFKKCNIVTRLHSTSSIIAYSDKEFHFEGMAEIFDLERIALRDSDLVVSHVPQIAEFNKIFFQLPENWLDRVKVEFPPILQEGLSVERESKLINTRNFVFPSKIQTIKNPELFVDGAVEFLNSNPSFEGFFVFACHDFSNSFGDLIERRVPEKWRNKFSRKTLSGLDRKTYLKSHICVIPSAYESLNLTAYEILSLGGTLLLNQDCLAFSSQSPFVEGQNCFKFQANPRSLADTMKKATTTGLVGSQALPKPDSPYWDFSVAERKFEDSNSTFSLTHVPVNRLELLKRKYKELDFIVVSPKGVLFGNKQNPAGFFELLAGELQKLEFSGVQALLCFSGSEIKNRKSSIAFPGPKATLLDSFNRSCSGLFVSSALLEKFLDFFEESQRELSLIESFQIFSEKGGFEVALYPYNYSQVTHRLPLSSVSVERRLYKQIVAMEPFPLPPYLGVLNCFSIFNLGIRYLGNSSMPLRYRLVDKVFLAIQPLWPVLKKIKRALGL